MNRSIAATIAALAFCAITGCPEKKADTSVELPFAGRQMRLAVPADAGFRDAWSSRINEWSAQSGAQCTLTEFDAAVSAEGKERRFLEGQTLAVFPLSRLGDLLASGGVAAIPESLLNDPQGAAWLDLFAGLRDSVASPGRVPSLLPVSCPVLVCYYRKDLLDAARRSAPRTWSDYQQLLDSLESWAPGLAAVEPWGEGFRATMFLARAVAHARHPAHYSLYFDIENGEPLIESAGFVRALEAAQVAVRRMPRAVLSMSPAECRAWMLEGRAALAVAIEPVGLLAAGTDLGAARPTNSRSESASIGFCRLPGARESFNPTRGAWEAVAGDEVNQVTLCGFAGLAVAALAGRPVVEGEAAWSAFAALRGEGFRTGLPAGAASLCRESQALVATDLVGPELDAGEAGMYLQAVAESLRDRRLVLELPVERRDDFRAALARELAAVFEGTTEPRAALSAVAKGWQEITAEIGAERLRDTYRIALGLFPTVRGKRPADRPTGRDR